MGYCSLLKKASQVGAFFVSALFLLPAEAYCPAPATLNSAKVQRVVDGDTVRLQDGHSIRLIGLNAPEMGRQGRSAEPFAEAARKRLAALIAANDGQVGVQLGREAKDRYGRTLAHLYDREGRNLEAQLLAEGLG
ncbi:MAG TPA: thermonuclease family protein, partial [Pseudomonas sp.]|nr:thermonuclease family protein [Pseudomonas sp.]